MWKKFSTVLNETLYGPSRVTWSNYKRFFFFEEKRTRWRKAKPKCSQHSCLLDIFVNFNNEQINVIKWGSRTLSHRPTHTCPALGICQYNKDLILFHCSIWNFGESSPWGQLKMRSTKWWYIDDSPTPTPQMQENKPMCTETAGFWRQRQSSFTAYQFWWERGEF